LSSLGSADLMSGRILFSWRGRLHVDRVTDQSRIGETLLDCDKDRGEANRFEETIVSLHPAGLEAQSISRHKEHFDAEPVCQVADREAVSIRQGNVADDEIEWPRAKKRHGGRCVDRRRDAMIAGYEDILD